MPTVVLALLVFAAAGAPPLTPAAERARGLADPR
jgi:hypothetical protein